MNNIYLRLTELLDRDITAYEYFKTLPDKLQQALYSRGIATFDELQSEADRLRSPGPFG